jgi:hypothetical protein
MTQYQLSPKDATWGAAKIRELAGIFGIEGCEDVINRGARQLKKGSSRTMVLLLKGHSWPNARHAFWSNRFSIHSGRGGKRQNTLNLNRRRARYVLYNSDT